MKDLEIGCIGCGFIADIHLRNASRMAGVHIRTVADRCEQAALEFHRRFHSDYWTTESKRLFEDPQLEAVLICTYPSSHAELALQAARAGKHIFVEKPMATSSADCLDMIRTCQQANVTLALDLKFRFSPAVLAVKKGIPRPVLVVAQTSMNPLPETDSNVDSPHAGGIVLDLGAHSLDLICFLAGSEPVRLFANATRLQHRKTAVLDAVAGTMELASGCLASFVISDCAEWPYASKWFFEVTDGRRNAVIHNHGRTAELIGEVNGLVDQSDIPAHEIGSFEALADFFNAIREDRAPKAGGTDGLRYAAIHDSLLESIRSLKPVDVTSPLEPEPWYKCEYATGQ
jgi:myo-inositol 2-dehydrogenase/D-chiro-inositol 1-dehydrogenase